MRNTETVFNQLTWTLSTGESWIILGNSGAGKTSFFQMLKGDLSILSGYVEYRQTPSENIEHSLAQFNQRTAYVFFREKGIRYDQYYYQQRYHSTDLDGTLTVRSFLLSGKSSEINLPENVRIFSFVEYLLDKAWIQLSHGESRKVMILKALMEDPEILCLDNPFMGLDTVSRTDLNGFLVQLMGEGKQILLTISGNRELPRGFTHILSLHRGNILFAGPRVGYVPENCFPGERSAHRPLPSFPEPAMDAFRVAVRLHQVTIRYQGEKVLDAVDLTILRGEKWALSGPNGAGKTMLCSLIYADNPQAYANDILLFDHKRGEGESIWDIKARIGFLSPEFHFFFQTDKSCLETVLSGYGDHPFQRRICGVEQMQFADALFFYYGVENLKGKRMQEVSSGMQRLVLWMRLLVKNPEFLVLDEPFAGFDETMVQKSKALLDVFCKNRTLLMISHHQEELPSCVDHFAQMSEGKLTL